MYMLLMPYHVVDSAMLMVFLRYDEFKKRIISEYRAF